MISNATRKRYDVVGFDPRGVGRSDPVECLTDKQTDQFLAADPTPTTPAEIADAVVQAKAFGADCVARTGPELGFVGTRDAAHDLDVMRSALGDAKLYYLGKSYGTFLGATYADEFPTHVGRMVLDGVIDPALTSQEINLGQAEGFEVATHAFLTDCAKRASCPLGRDPAQAEVRLDAFLTGLDARPLPTKDRGRVLTEGLATLGVALPLYNKSYWPLLRTALSQALGGNGQGLLTLADNYSDRAAQRDLRRQQQRGDLRRQLPRPLAAGWVGPDPAGRHELRRAGAHLGQPAGLELAGLRLLPDPADRPAEGGLRARERADPRGRYDA